MQKHTTGGIPRWSPTLVLVARFSAYVWQSGRDAQFSLTCGRMCQQFLQIDIYSYANCSRPQQQYGRLCALAIRLINMRTRRDLKRGRIINYRSRTQQIEA